MKTLVTLLTVIGLLTLTSCKQDTDVNTMMRHNADYHYWGMHMGWWISNPEEVPNLFYLTRYLRL